MKRLASLAAISALVFAAHSATPQTSPRANQPPTVAQPALDPRPGYIGDSACMGCHRSQGLSYAHTSHRLTSQLANKQTVLGNFDPGGTILTISNPADHPAVPALYFKMEVKSGRFYQTAATGWANLLLTRTEPLDVVTGSGVRGQTYLYWQGDRLFELPVSYWTDGHRWVNSPGFTDGTVDFSRPINPGCLECHATYIRPLSADPLTNSYEKPSLVTGLACEICHGPGAEHSKAYANRSSNDPVPSKSAILNPSKFPRDRQVDACAYCHSGTQREPIAPAFSFVPGHALSEYFKPLETGAATVPDVHGNQVGLLQRSRCYQSSPDMSCSTCHNTHAAEKPAASYSSACLKCHQWTSCGESRKLGHAIVNDCIECHMPVQPTNVIVSETAGQVLRARMRNHWIKTYSDPQTQ